MNRHLLASLIPLAVAGWLSACGGGTSSKDTSTAPPSTSAPLAEQIKALEASGQMPQLDRSSDIRGPDNDNNGIRDDVDAWIVALSITDAQKKATQQMARVQQAKLLADLNDKAALQVLGEQSAAGVICLADVFMPDYQKGYDLGSQLEAMVANTKQRARQYLAYNRARSGSSGRLPEGNTCAP